MLREVMREVVHDYMFLRHVSPKNELLKYFIVEGNSLRNNCDEEISDEFMERFRGDFPTLEELKENKVKVNHAKYFSQFSLNVFINYINSLEREIYLAEMMN